MEMWETVVRLSTLSFSKYDIMLVGESISRVVGGGMLFGVECAVAYGWIYSQACFDLGWIKNWCAINHIDKQLW